jgi:hypothetical protein
MNLDRSKYIELCRQRWSGIYYSDANRNWHDFEEINEDLVDGMREFRRNPTQEDIFGRHHNETGSLNGFLWNLQVALEPDRSCLRPLLDFNDDSQTVFLRRGLIAYCTLILRELEAEAAGEAGQLKLQLA